jgi:hypothetical protein
MAMQVSRPATSCSQSRSSRIGSADPGVQDGVAWLQSGGRRSGTIRRGASVPGKRTTILELDDCISALRSQTPAVGFSSMLHLAPACLGRRSICAGACPHGHRRNARRIRRAGQRRGTATLGRGAEALAVPPASPLCCARVLLGLQGSAAGRARPVIRHGLQPAVPACRQEPRQAECGRRCAAPLRHLDAVRPGISTSRLRRVQGGEPPPTGY